MTKLEKIKGKFYYTPDGEIDINFYGEFRLGLTTEEIYDYLRARANKINVKKLFKRFCDIAGVNTMGGYICPGCGLEHSLMYRHDVLRFADILFGKTEETYFD